MNDLIFEGVTQLQKIPTNPLQKILHNVTNKGKMLHSRKRILIHSKVSGWLAVEYSVFLFCLFACVFLFSTIFFPASDLTIVCFKLRKRRDLRRCQNNFFSHSLLVYHLLAFALIAWSVLSSNHRVLQTH